MLSDWTPGPTANAVDGRALALSTASVNDILREETQCVICHLRQQPLNQLTGATKLRHSYRKYSRPSEGCSGGLTVLRRCVMLPDRQAALLEISLSVGFY